MGKVKDKQTIVEMTRDIERYFRGRESLLGVIQVIELSTRRLDSVGSEWKKQIFGEWVDLEFLVRLSWSEMTKTWSLPRKKNRQFKLLFQ